MLNPFRKPACSEGWKNLIIALFIRADLKKAAKRRRAAIQRNDPTYSTPYAPVPVLHYSSPTGHPGTGGAGSPGQWIDMSGGQVPPGAVVGGQDRSGEPMYVVRARHKGAIIPGKLVQSHGAAYVPWGGKEHGKPEYQVLVGGFNNWVPTNGSNIPPGAFPGGQSEDGETLYIGRVRHKGSLITGKVQQSHGVCYISFAGKELSFPKYEILLS
ncbi:hypothetical protein ABMA28_007223 [Loxostege sticticalis]|uniref:Uncharacterized protein n=1 Tax=Loxostege sticticalis TaxID=481309 RepID=A0ABD0TPX2_LOXSC